MPADEQPKVSLIVRVEHESDHGTVVVPVRVYWRSLTVAEVRDNLARYPIAGLDPSQLTPLPGAEGPSL